MISEREREALMRLTMCAREECDMCKYAYRCNFDFQRELATKNMYILADALRVDRKTEPTHDLRTDTHDKDEPQTGYCNECKWYGDRQVCGRRRSRNLYAPKDEPQTEREE